MFTKKSLFPCVLLLSFISLSSGICSKSDINQVDLEKYPQDWILTVDESVDLYTYLEVNGNNMKRSKVQKTYSLIQLAEDDDCEFHVAQSRSSNQEICYTLQLNKKRARWIHAHQSSNKQEMHLAMSSNTASEFTPPGDGDEYKFFVHKFPDVNGVKTVALESVMFPGWYISANPPGLNYSPTQVTLSKESAPDRATKWQCR